MVSEAERIVGSVEIALPRSGRDAAPHKVMLSTCLHDSGLRPEEAISAHPESATAFMKSITQDNEDTGTPARIAAAFASSSLASSCLPVI